MTSVERRPFATALRARLLPHLAFFILGWPLLAIALGVAFLKEQPITLVLAWQTALAGISAGAMNLVPELLVLGLIAGLTGALAFAAVDRTATRWTWLEPVAVLFAIVGGFAMELPALLRHPMLMPLRPVPVWIAQVLVPLIALVLALAGGKRLPRVAAVAAVFFLAWGVTLTPHLGSRRVAPRDSVFILGLDSLSQSDPLAPLRQTVAGANGTWYEHAVTPGLLTNSVWVALFQHRHPHETGVFLTYQRPDWKRSPYQLVSEGKRRGFETWSFFSDQFTTHVGAHGGFDVNRSGPVGWLQLATASMKESHILGPVLLPRLPRIPLARTPRNQSGTFGYRLSAELHGFFTAGSRDSKIFAVGHVDYLHQPGYPGMSDLTPHERGRVRRAPVDKIWDLSLHWQYPDFEGEPLGIYAWKIARLQRFVSDALRESGAADPARRNRIILLSDHGNRKDVGPQDFARQRYYKVLLATIGIPPRNPRMPISLLDLPLLLGWPDPSRPHPAALVVEYANNESLDEWRRMMETATLTPTGEVILQPRVTAELGRRLLAYRPHSGVQAYFRVPVVPTELTLGR
ncbi:MAG TPA: hypothetical protein VGF28_21370 [Thermoanaerobaculia bacterium]